MAAIFRFSLLRTWLAAVAGATMLVADGGSARAGCVDTGSARDCTGDLATGVQLHNGGGPFTTLNVFGLTNDIASSLPGVEFTSDANVVLNVDTGDFSILTTSANTPGIYAESANGSIIIDAAANIRTSGFDSAAIAAAANAGDIRISSRGNISTSGAGSSLFEAAFGISATSLTGNITVNSDSDITTTGVSAAGILAFTDGSVTVVSTGNITTTGVSADGIDAVSGSGTATVISLGNVSATGVGSSGIVASGQDALVENYGTVIGGPCCDAIGLSGNTATLRNYGTIIGNSTGFAIFATGNDVIVDNFATVTGNVFAFGASSAVFNNHAGALLNSGEELSAGVIINDGTIAPGGRGTVLTTENPFGGLVQNVDGIYAVDLDPQAATSDYINLVDTAALAGKVDVNLLSLPLGAAQSFLILTAANGAIDNGLGVVASPALHSTLLFDPNGQDVYLGIAVDFAVDGLNRNQRAIALSLDHVFTGGAGGLGPALLGLLNVDDLGQYKNALDQLSPEIYADAEISALYAGLAFSSSLLSCKVNGTDTASIIREGQCLWAGASARFLNTNSTSQQIGFNETAGLFNAGAQIALDDVWRLGFAGGYQSSTLNTATGATSDGDLGQAGIALKYNPGALLLAGTLTGGGAHYDTRRPMAFGGFTGIAESGHDLGIFSASLRAAYVLGSPHLYAKPILDASVTQLELGGFTESGGGGAALSVESASNTVFAITPSVEVGTEFWLGNGTLVRPMIRLGGVFYAGDDLAVAASFADAPAGVAPFTIRTDLDDAMGLVGAGLDVINGNDAALRLSYDGQIGETTRIHAVGVKGSARF